MTQGRRLGLLETFYLGFDRLGGTNFVGIVQFDSLLARDWLIERLAKIQDLFWVLQVRLDSAAPSRISFTTENVPSIPLREEAADKNSIPALAADELHTPFSFDVGPLIRCLHIKHNDQTSTLLLTLSHCVADGFTGHLILKALLEEPSTFTDGAKSPSPLAEDRIPSQFSGIAGIAKMANVLPERFFCRLQVMSPPRGKIPDVRIPKVCSFTLEPPETAQLHLLARLNGVTIYDVLCVAQALALAQLLQRNGTVALSSGVNLRRGRRPKDALPGLLSCGLLTYHQVRLTDSVWHLAQQAKRTFAREVKRGEPYLGLNAVTSLVKLLQSSVGSRLSAMSTLEWISKKALPWHMPVTYMGALTINRDTALVLPASISGALLGPPDWCLGSVANIYDGRLYWNFIYIEPDIDGSCADLVCSNTVENLRKSLQAIS